MLGVRQIIKKNKPALPQHYAIRAADQTQVARVFGVKRLHFGHKVPSLQIILRWNTLARGVTRTGVYLKFRLTVQLTHDEVQAPRGSPLATEFSLRSLLCAIRASPRAQIPL